MRHASIILCTAFAVFTLAASAQASGDDPPTGPGVIGDFVWHDENGNGMQDDPNSGIAGVLVVLKMIDPDEDVVIQELTTTTNAAGRYFFQNLAVADDDGNDPYLYEVFVSRHPSDGNFQPGGPLHGMRRTLDHVGHPELDSDGLLALTTLPAPLLDTVPMDLSIDFGFVLDAAECSLEVHATCRAIDPPPSADACDSGKLTSMVLEYVGGGCDAGANNQGSKTSCVGSVGFTSPVDILISNGSNVAHEPAAVIGDQFIVLPEPGRTSLKSSTDVELGGGAEAVEIHTSCSAPISVGDRFGSLLVVALGTTGGGPVSMGPGAADCSVAAGQDVEFHYEVTNHGPSAAQNVSLTDAFGAVDQGIAHLAAGNSTSITVIESVWDDLRGDVTAEAFQCSPGADTIHVKVVDATTKSKKTKKAKKSKKAKSKKAKNVKLKKAKSKKAKKSKSKSKKK